MSMQDPISDMLTRIRNASAVGKKQVVMPGSTLKMAIADVLKDEGYVVDVCNAVIDKKPVMTVVLKYFEGAPVISSIDRISRPSLRRYRGRADLPRVQNGLGTAIVSTSKGVMTAQKARKAGVGGEILCQVI